MMPTASPPSASRATIGSRSARKNSSACLSDRRNIGASEPVTSPSTTYGPISHAELSWNDGTRYITCADVSTRMVRVATTADTASGPRLSMAIEPRMISATKKEPAIGALYADAMPAAAPQATRSRSCGPVNCRQRPRMDATTAASCTIGPSRPIEPPEPMENSAAVLFTRLARTGIRPLPIAMASM